MLVLAIDGLWFASAVVLVLGSAFAGALFACAFVDRVEEFFPAATNVAATFGLFNLSVLLFAFGTGQLSAETALLSNPLVQS